MARKKKRSFQVFSISFLDCICCGFGAVLLLFVLTSGKKEEDTQQHLSEIQEILGQLENDVTEKTETVQRLARRAEEEQERIRSLEEKSSTESTLKLTLEQQLALLLRQQSTVEDELRRLMEEKEAIPTQEERSVPVPNVTRRQYLTGVKLEGDHILFLVRASGSMLGETLEEAVFMQREPVEAKRAAPKWQRVVRSIEWLVGYLGEDTSFQIWVFNENTRPLLTDGPEDWIRRGDLERVRAVFDELADIVPGGGANMERAFTRVRQSFVVPDSVVLITDGLPTQSDSFAVGGTVSDADRIRFFQAAMRVLPADIPVSTLMFPFTGDPAGPFLYWELAARTRGSLLSPAATWPDT